MRLWAYLFLGVFCFQTQNAFANNNRNIDLYIFVADSRFKLTETADGKKKVEPHRLGFDYKVNLAAMMSNKFGPSNGATQDRRSVFAETFEGITVGDFETSMLTLLKRYGLSNLKSDQFLDQKVPYFKACEPNSFSSMDAIILLYRADVENGPFSPLIQACIEKGEMRLVGVIDSADWITTIAAANSKGKKLRDFANLFSPSLTSDKSEDFFSFGVTDGDELEDVFNRMSADNFTQATLIDEDVLLDFLRHEAAGKREGLSAKAYKDKKRAENIAAQKRAEERAKKLAAAREKIEVMPVAVCIGGNKKGQTQTLVNLFNSNNTPATASYMLDAGCNNRWATKIRGGDLKEFYRYGGYVGVHTKEFMSGIGWIYAVIKASDWDVPIK